MLHAYLIVVGVRQTHLDELSLRQYRSCPSHGHIKRSKQAKDRFKKSHICPSTGKASGACPGYEIDHVIPLKRGGEDAPNNMQWQTEVVAEEKD